MGDRFRVLVQQDDLSDGSRFPCPPSLDTMVPCV
jgi:hypothetical protein